MTRLQLRVDDLEWRSVDDEIVVLDLASGSYLTLNGSAGVLFRRLIDGATSQDLVASLLDEYDTTAEQATTDVAGFVESLRANNLLVD